jgi:type I restriction enzyme R subunit
MLDTGIDVPEVVNLVFFKLVRSRTKFWQMIGRGTRLCPNLFGPGQDKRFFYIFDFCQNLEYFSQNPQGVEGQAQRSLSATLFVRRLELHEGTAAPARQDEKVKALREEVAETLRTTVAAMNVENFLVRPRRKAVEKFREAAAWEKPTPSDYAQADDELADLPAELPQEDEEAKRFDLLMLRLQLALLHHEKRFEGFQKQVMEIAGALGEKNAIPMVAAEMPLILELQTDAWWQDVTLPMLDHARKRLRSLVKFIDKGSKGLVFTNFEDDLGEGVEIDLGGIATAVDTANYRKRVLDFLKAHENHIAVRRVRMGEPLTATDLKELERLLYETSDLGGKEAFERAFGPQKSLGLFIRSLVGLDRAAAQKTFGEFLDGSRHNANQIRFVNLIIEHLTRNGVMDPGQLYESPYTDASPAGLDGLFDDAEAERIVFILEEVRKNAGAARMG